MLFLVSPLCTACCVVSDRLTQLKMGRRHRWPPSLLLLNPPPDPDNLPKLFWVSGDLVYGYIEKVYKPLRVRGVLKPLSPLRQSLVMLKDPTREEERGCLPDPLQRI